MSAALVNEEVKRKNKQSSSSSTTANAMTARGMCSNYQEGKKESEKSKTSGHEDLKKNQCAFCREGGQWKINYLKIKLKKKEPILEANIAHGNDFDSSGYSFSITPVDCY